MFKKFFGKKDSAQPRQETDLDREISALYGILVDVMGSDRLVLQAGKMDALRYMRSHDPAERVLALRRILEENPTLYPPPKKSEIHAQVRLLSEMIADIMARRQIEDKIERKINEKLEKEHQDYVKDIRMQILREEDPKAESPHDKKSARNLSSWKKFISRNRSWNFCGRSRLKKSSGKSARLNLCVQNWRRPIRNI